MNLDECMEAALAVLPPGAAQRFGHDPMGTLRELGLSATRVDHLTQSRDDGGACDGMSFLAERVILYAPTPSSKRQNFTVAHEVGHWLVDQCDHVLDWLADQPNAGPQVETVCDRVASKLLLPTSAVASVVSGQALTAQHVLDLHHSSHASRPACAIALAGTMNELGAVVLIDTDTMQVRTSSVTPDPVHGWPHVFPWNGQHVPSGHPLKQLADGGHLCRRTFWRDSFDREANFYIDAVRERTLIVAVFSGTDIWGAERLHLEPARTYDQRPQGHVYCCGQDRVARGYPCDVCGQHYCPNCGKCTCDRRAAQEVMCEGGCYIRYAPHLLVNGLCEECR